MRDSIEPKDWIYVKGYGFLSFPKNMGKNIGKNLSVKHNQKLIDSATHATKVAKKSKTDAIKTTSKRATQATAEATGDLIDNKIVDKITNSSEKYSQNVLKTEDELEIPKERNISPEKRRQIIDELRLV